ncbi:MAG: hypothetical protein JNK09_13705 [Prolixibacteraceae bacterium]|nr:hypothetical protein [Prolixibacteraceae bacterium]
MRSKRKILLGVTILIIVVCYGFALYSIINHSDSPDQTQSVSENKDKYRVYDTNTSLKKESKYVGNQLQNGTSPFDTCFGKGVYSGNASLTIKNGAGSDAIVCLYSISLNRTIRNEYVQKNTSLMMEKISQGTYKIRVFYGNDWNPELENPCGVKGYFDSDVYFSEFDGTEYFEDSHDGYTVATVTLYTVAGGNASTSRINQSDFFRN